MIEDLKKFYMTVEKNQKLYEKIKKLTDDYNFKDGINKDFIRKKLIPIGKELGFEFTCEEVLNYENQENSDYLKISDDKLLEVAGGKMERKALGMGLLTIMLYGGLVNAASNDRSVEVYTGSASNNIVKSSKLEKAVKLNIEKDIYDRNNLVKFISDAVVSEVQMKAFEITNALALQKRNNVAMLDEISSLRYSKYGKIKTRVERMLDEGIDKGDLPIKEFFINEIEKTKNCFIINKTDKEVKFIIPEKEIDAIDMHKFIEDESIVQVSSQFNALESPSDAPSAVCNWIYDRTQGARAALQSVVGSKHREAAHLQGKLPDAIQGLLDACIIEDDRGKPISITDKYPLLYKNGYLNLCEVKNEKNIPKKGFIKKVISIFKKSDDNEKMENKKSDLEVLREHIHNNIGRMKFLSQWVLCEETGKKQLQVFNSGASFQDQDIKWDNNDEKTLILKDISKEIIVNQYRALAQVAAIRAQYAAKPVCLHLTMVGQGAFKNPPEIITHAIKAVSEELKGTNVKVYLHGLTESNRTGWEKILKEIGAPYESIAI